MQNMVKNSSQGDREPNTTRTVITFGTYDLLHIGHINILQRAAKHGDRLVVGVSSDALNFSKKQALPVYNEEDRMAIIRNIKGVDEVFLEESLELKLEYVLAHKADVLVMGNDWEGKFDFLKTVCEVVYLPRTENISTTSTKEKISGNDSTTRYDLTDQSEARPSESDESDE